MSAKKISQEFQASLRQRQRLGRPLAQPAVVGTIHSAKSLQRALQTGRGEVDFFELRVDHFFDAPERLFDAVPRLRAPLIVTVRHHNEGGAVRLQAWQRRELFARFLPVARLIDIELRSIADLQQTITAARARGIQLILSDHRFRVTPSAAHLISTVRRAKAAGADIVKIVARVSDSKQMGRLLALFARRISVPLSLMGMGPLGKVSRLLFACAGSVLNYGYLGEPQVPGQWEAVLLKRRLAELFTDA